MMIREIQREVDCERLSAFDTSFETEYIYNVKINGMSVEIAEEKLDAPFRKTYPFDAIKTDIDEADFTVIAEIEQKIAGFAMVKYEAWNARAGLTGIFVAPKSRGKGVGRVLVEAAAAYAKSESARCLFVETQNVNYPAIRFYLRMNFEFCGFDRSLYHPADVSRGETAFYFCKQLRK